MKKFLSTVLLLCLLLSLALSACADKTEPGRIPDEPDVQDPRTTTPDSDGEDGEQEPQPDPEPEIEMYDAEPLPVELTFKNLLRGGEYEIVVKDVTFREITAIEEEIAYSHNLGYVAIIKYSARPITEHTTPYLHLQYEGLFAIVLGDTVHRHDIRIANMDESEFTTEDYSDGYYQNCVTIEVSQEVAESESTQLRYIAKGSNDAVYYNIYEQEDAETT